MVDRYIVNVEAAVVDQNGRYLMVIRGEDEEHAAGMLSLIGGKVEVDDPTDDVFEATLHREILEETGVEVDAEMAYVESKVFFGQDGEELIPVADIVFLCRHRDGEPVIGDPGEVADVRWMTAGEIRNNPTAPPWTRQSIERCETRRASLSW